MSVSFTGLNNAVLRSWGDEVIIKTGSGDYIFDAVYFAPFKEYTLGGDILSKPDHVIVMRTADYESTSPDDGDLVVVKGMTLQIVDSEKDSGGMVAVSLRGDVV